jgi:peptidoglycan/xylan/chitin deacetylase (PgdA/CDA1 family)
MRDEGVLERGMNHRAYVFAAFTLVLLCRMASAAEPLPEHVPPGSVPVAITVDDLGTTGAETVEKIAKALRTAGVTDAYGFVVGSRVHDDRDNEESVRVWLRYGHQIANHTFTHKGYHTVSTEFFKNDIIANEPVLKEFVRPGDDWHWFRYPHLSEGDTPQKRQAVQQFLKNMPNGQSYRIAQGTVDFGDWLFDPAFGRCLKQGRTDRIEWLKQIYLDKATRSLVEARQNSRQMFGREIPQIFLVHYGRFTAEVMPELLDALKASGARFISLKEAQSDPVFELDFGIALPSGENFLNSHLLARFPPTDDAEPARASAWKSKVKEACPEQTRRLDP